MSNLSRREFLRVGAVGIAGVGLAQGMARGEEPFTFATINDTHITDAASVAIVDEAVAAINADVRIRFTCALGDVATDGKEKELALCKAAFDNLHKPYHVVPGNHDVFPEAEDIYANYTEAFGPVHWTHTAAGWKFIGMNSCEGAKSDVTVSDDELAWLQARLEETDPHQPLALFCHHPMNPNTKAYRILNADAILSLFAGHNLKIVAAGHWHGNQVEEADGVLFVTTACCATTRDNFDGTSEKGYRLFHLAGDSVETEFVVVRG